MNADTTSINDTRVKTQFFNNTKAFHGVRQANGDYECVVDRGQNISVLMTTSAPENVITSQEITLFDQCVMDTVFTILESGENVFTLDKITRILHGAPDKRPSDAAKKRVEQSMDKLGYIKISINFTEQYKRLHPKSDARSMIYKSSLIPYDEITGVFAGNGRTVKAYRVSQMPALYQYAKDLKQIISVPSEWLNTSKYFSDTPESVVIKRYVLTRLCQRVRGESAELKKISLFWQDYNSQGEKCYKGLIPSLGYDPESRDPSYRKKIKPRIIKALEGTLDALIDNGVVAGYRPYRLRDSVSPNQPVAGYMVSLNPSAFTRSKKTATQKRVT